MMTKILLWMNMILQLIIIVTILFAYQQIIDVVYDSNDSFIKACGYAIGNE